MNTIHNAISTVVGEMMASGRCRMEEIAARVERDYPDLVEQETERLIRGRLRDIAKRILRELSNEDSAQLSFSGLSIPSAIAVENEKGDIVYVRSDVATWSDLQKGIAPRDKNIKHALAKKKQYMATLKRLQPLMENNPNMTVADALRAEKLAA